MTILGISIPLVAPGPTLRLRPTQFPISKIQRKPRLHHDWKGKYLWQSGTTTSTAWGSIMEFVPWKHLSSFNLLQTDHSSIYLHILRKTVEVVSPGILVIYKEVALLCAPAGSLPLQAPQGQSMLSPELGHHRSRKWSKVINSGLFLFKTIRLERLIDFMWMYEKLCWPGFHFSKLIK